jgi:hypothetical protein
VVDTLKHKLNPILKAASCGNYAALASTARILELVSRILTCPDGERLELRK